MKFFFFILTGKRENQSLRSLKKLQIVGKNNREEKLHIEMSQKSA